MRLSAPRMLPRHLDPGQRGADRGAAYVLRANSAGTMTRAAPDLYPHQWSWDSAFVAAGLAHVDLERACLELNSLLAVDGGPGWSRTSCSTRPSPAIFPDRTAGRAPNTLTTRRRPRERAASASRRSTRSPSSASSRWPQTAGAAAAALKHGCRTVYPRLLAWHRYLARDRDPDGTGLLTIYHGWESGMDNSPRWDEAYSRVTSGPDLPPYERRDTGSWPTSASARAPPSTTVTCGSSSS